MSTTISNQILSVMRRRQVKGLTVGEIFDRVYASRGIGPFPVYSSIRARVSELVDSGDLEISGDRKDDMSGRTALTYTRPQSQ